MKTTEDTAGAGTTAVLRERGVLARRGGTAGAGVVHLARRYHEPGDPAAEGLPVDIREDVRWSPWVEAACGRAFRYKPAALRRGLERHGGPASPAPRPSRFAAPGTLARPVAHSSRTAPGGARRPDCSSGADRPT